ncbi:hypothetical protein THASP1DRAFT_33713 [Thamnocephalis sphaerospora]|uniref:Uncharacterized protein n=1 Tax=Thamnocephalis sphaerospora TaxID=78915 RepID=A0A4P9XFX2_9FUNG|nr:hypothetical protein THASP1DRAFT_33713 [Thamnocephalis sphaerospora]|eukprot:RKP04513.1 hypothetical protein THASP1DRAFT_33713 [Thamnocephalis sphaerospora]
MTRPMHHPMSHHCNDTKRSCMRIQPVSKRRDTCDTLATRYIPTDSSNPARARTRMPDTDPPGKRHGVTERHGNYKPFQQTQ